MAILGDLLVQGRSRFLQKIYAASLDIGEDTTIAGTLTLSKTNDAIGTSDNSPALVVGGTATTAHLELDSNEIMAKTNATTAADIYINANGGVVYLSKSGIETQVRGNLRVQGTSTFTDASTHSGNLTVSGTTSLAGTSISSDLNVANNAKVNGVLTVEEEIRSPKWIVDNIANLGGEFIIAPTIVCESNTSVNISGPSNNLYTITVTDGSITSNIFGGIAWSTGSVVKVSGTINDTVLVSINGTMTRALNQTTGTIQFTVSSSNITLTAGTYTGTKVKNLHIMMYKVGNVAPVGIFMTSYGQSHYPYIDIYSGTTSGSFYSPTTRLGYLNGLTDENGNALKINNISPTGWGLYTSNGYFSGTIVSTSGKIGGFNLDTTKIYSGTNSISSTTVGVYLGIDGIRNYNSASQSVTIKNGVITAIGADVSGKITATSGEIGGFTIDSSSIHTKNVAVTSNADNSISLSSTDFTRTINSTSRAGLRFAIGDKFGITGDGVLYTNGANITNINANNISTGTVSVGVLPESVKNENIEIGGRNLLYKRASAGGRTTVNDDYSIILNASENSDTYFSLYTRTQLVEGTTYVISCEASGINGEGVYYNFPLFRQGSTINGLTINKNGINSFSFVMNDTELEYHVASTVDGLTVYQIMMDDQGRNIEGQTGPITLTNFKLEKGNIVTDWTPAPEDVVASIDANSTGLGIKWNYSAFSDSNNGEAYLCAHDASTGTFTDAAGWVWFNGAKRTVPKGMVNPNSIALNKTIYIVCRLSSASATTGTNYIVWYDSGWKYLTTGINQAASGASTETWTWANATDIVLGNFVMLDADSSAIVNCQQFTPPLTSQQVTSGDTSYAKAAAAQSTANAAAPKSSAISRTQRIYWRATSNTKPSANTTWLSTSGDGYGNWSLNVPQLTKGTTKYPFLYTAVQSQTVAQQAAGTTCTCSAVMIDDSTTIIDGGNIITGSIVANKIQAGTITADKLDTTSINSSGILTLNAFASTAQSDILNSNVEIGGRNLLRNTNWNLETIEKFKTATSTTNVLGNAIGEWHRETQATLGFDESGLMTITVPNSGSRFGIYQDVSLSPGHYILSIDTGSFFKSHIDSVQWPAKNQIQGSNSRNSVEIDVTEEAVYRVYIASNNGTIMYGNYMKLEKGNKATDWTPAPEDVSASLSLKANKDTLTTEINASADTVKINADRVNIEGAAIFSSGRLSQTSLDNAYDANGAAADVQANLDAATAPFYYGRANSTGYIHLGYVPYTVGSASNYSHLHLTGRIGGWLSTTSGSIDITFKSRDNNASYNTVDRKDSAIDTSFVDILVYTGTDNYTHYWLKVNSYWYAQLYAEYEQFTQGEKIRVTDAPTGTCVWKLSEQNSVLNNTANAREQTIYHSAGVNTTSMAATQVWVTDPASGGGEQNVWTTTRPEYDSQYPVLFVAMQRQTIAQMGGTTCTCTTPTIDKTTTVIDGGRIITGSITADAINANAITANLMKANVISAVNNGTGTINADKINTSNLHILATNVDNLNIGGTNLLPSTGTWLGHYGSWSIDTTDFLNFKVLKYTWSSGTVDGGSWGNLEGNYNINIKPDTDYVLSFWAKADVDNRRLKHHFYPNLVVSGVSSSGTTTTAADGNIDSILTTAWQRYWVKWHTASSISGNHNLIVGRVYTTGTFYIAGAKFEEGSIATAWSPAPEDLDVHKYITDIDSNNGITIKPINTAGNDYLQINSSAISFYRNNVETLKLEDSALRVGKVGTNLRNIYITDSEVQIRNNTTAIAKFGSTLTFYEPGTTTVAAEVDSNGINVKVGTFGNATNKITVGTGTSGHSAIRYGMTTLADTTNNGFYIGTDGIALGKGVFKVTAAGTLYANGANITNINANNINAGTLNIGYLPNEVKNENIKLGTRNFLTGTATLKSDSGSYATATYRVSGGGTLSNPTTSGLPLSLLTSAIRCTNTGSSAVQQAGFCQDGIPGIVAGETYTQSAWIRASTSIEVYFQPFWSGVGYTTGSNVSNSFSITTSWQWFEWTGILAGSQKQTYSGGYVYAKNLPAGAWFEVCGLKLERGNKATDWTPAPEDVNADVANAATTATNYISTNANGIRIASASPSTQNMRIELTSSAAKLYSSDNIQRLSLDSTTGVVVGNPSKGRVMVNDVGLTIYDTNNHKRSAIDSDGLEVFAGTDSTSVAKFGTSARIGKASDAHVVVKPTYFMETTPSGANLFEVGRILDDDGYADYVDVEKPSEDTSVFALTYRGQTIKGYTYNSQTTEVTINPLTVSVDGAVTSAYTLSAVAEAGGDVVHVTLNTAAVAGSIVQIAYRTTAAAVLSMQFGRNAQATGECSSAFGVGSIASGTGALAEGGYYTVNGDFTDYYNGGTAKGDASHAEGVETIASGRYSHTEGYRTMASKPGSHAEGDRSTASGSTSHAEGFNTKASDTSAHAEGDTTTASNFCAHAEGSRTTASGEDSHAEGYRTTASSWTAHAQNFYTTAGYSHQTAIGKFNSNQSNNAFEIGNGTSDSTRSNALTVDWDGNLVTQGMAGMVQMFAGSTAPTGWLLCHGQAISRTDYATLFAAIGTTWGAGNGSTTFNVPDLRGRAPIGAGSGSGLTSRTLGGKGGSEYIQAHTHSFTQPTVKVKYSKSVASGSAANHIDGSSSSSTPNPMEVSGGAVGAVSGATTGSAGNMQPFAVINFIICTGKTS